MGGKALFKKECCSPPMLSGKDLDKRLSPKKTPRWTLFSLSNRASGDRPTLRRTLRCVEKCQKMQEG
jgi:hypothetical protein